ncbi:MAG: hypothetical protein WB919_01990 [Candidatus Sulfotelmatobacter sp.]
MADLGKQITDTIADCLRELDNSGLFSVAEKFRQGTIKQSYEAILRSLLAASNRERALLALASELGLTPEQHGTNTAALQRVILAEVAVRNLERLADFPLEASVKSMVCDYCRFFVNPPPREIHLFEPNQYSFLALSKIALLERFPAGQFDWEVSGLPRSWVPKVPIYSLPKVAYFIAARFKGFSPCIVPHMAFRRKNPLMLIQRECEKAWYRMAISAEFQPEIRGLVACSWFFSKETFKVSPHLSFMIKPFLESGALLTTRGNAHVEEGFLTGSEARKKLYESGEFKPTMGLVLWARDQMIQWAHQHPELADG